MNAIDYISYLTANALLEVHTAESAYELYANSNADKPSSLPFFRAKFNAKKRSLNMTLEITSGTVEPDPVVIPEIKEEIEEVITSPQIKNITPEEVLNLEETPVEIVNEPINITVSKERREGNVSAFQDRLKEEEDKKESISIELNTEEINNLSEITEEPTASIPDQCKETIDHIKERVSKPKGPAVFQGVGFTGVDFDGNTHTEEDVKGAIEDMVEEKGDEIKVDDFGDVIAKEKGLEITVYNDGSELPPLSGLIPTGTLFDKVICDRITTDEQKLDLEPRDWLRGGFTRKCCDVTAGGAGSGKTYSRTMLACMAKAIDPTLRIGFVCGEMREVEWLKEVHSSPILAELEVIYMMNYVGQTNYEKVFYEAIAMFDIVIVDSFTAIISHIKMSPKEKRNDKTITFDMIREINLSVDKNDNNVQLINQATKDGNYKGGTELPHMMSSQSFVRVDGQQRYMQFEKNRNNGTTINRKLYFTKNDVTGMLEFNEEVYKATYEQTQNVKQDLNEFFANNDTSKKA